MIVRANRAAAEATGCAAHLLPGRPFFTLIDRPDVFLRFLRTLRRGGGVAWSEDLRLRTDGGSSVRAVGGVDRTAETPRISMVLVPRDGGAAPAGAGLLDGVPDAVSVVDAEGRVVVWNRAAERLYGRPRAAVLGRRLENVLEVDAAETPHRSADARRLADAVHGRGPIVRTTTTEVEWAPGVRGRMRVDRDLAEERLAEASATRTRAAGAARLADADALLRAVSHDLRQPLRTALDHLALLRKRKAPALGDDGGELLAFAADSVRRAERILGDLLDVFRAERRGGVAASADPAAAIADAVANLARRKGRAPAPTVAGAPPRVAIPHPLLVQIFQNLLDNAARHGGDRMTTIDAVRSGALVRFSIVDRGAGVDARKFDRLLHGPRSGGLGLAICSRAVEGAGGRLWAEPTAAGGAAIVFELPAFKP